MRRKIAFAVALVAVSAAVSLALGAGIRKTRTAKPPAVTLRPNVVLRGGTIRLQSAGQPIDNSAWREFARAKRAEQVETYLGTKISPNPKATGQVLKFHQQIATRFSEEDPVPPFRVQHFRWLESPSLQFNGWHGSIIDVVAGDTGPIVKMRISPLLVSTVKGGVPFTTDYFIESYSVTDEGLHFLSGEAPPANHIKAIITD